MNEMRNTYPCIILNLIQRRCAPRLFALLVVAQKTKLYRASYYSMFIRLFVKYTMCPISGVQVNFHIIKFDETFWTYSTYLLPVDEES